MDARRFTVINESFICDHCGCMVQPLVTGCRNHCPACLYSLHLDKNPGDRAAACGGSMVPVRIEMHSKKGLMVHHRCTRCGAHSVNKLATDDPRQPDDMNVILEKMRAQSMGS